MSLFGKPRSRQVRIHLSVHPPTLDHDGTMTIEGFMVGRQPVAGHYLLARPKIIELRVAEDARSEIRRVTLDGAEIPERRVIFVEVLAVDGEK